MIDLYFIGVMDVISTSPKKRSPKNKSPLVTFVEAYRILPKELRQEVLLNVDDIIIVGEMCRKFSGTCSKRFMRRWREIHSDWELLHHTFYFPGDTEYYYKYDDRDLNFLTIEIHKDGYNIYLFNQDRETGDPESTSEINIFYDGKIVVHSYPHLFVIKKDDKIYCRKCKTYHVFVIFPEAVNEFLNWLYDGNDWEKETTEQLVEYFIEIVPKLFPEAFMKQKYIHDWDTNLFYN